MFKRNVTVPVYMINGFLESGKTSFIAFTLEQDYFQIEGKTLLIMCEEGMEEYDEELLEASNTVVEVIEEESEFTPEHLAAVAEKHHPERIIIEYNGMWLMRNKTLPANWEIEQQITHVDASTFEVYYKNMKSLFGEMVKNSDMVIFNRCDMIEDLGSLRRTVQAVNMNAEVVFEDEEGEVQEMTEEDLPYDLNADIIELEGPAYAIWYMDALENPGRYDGKVVRYKGLVMHPGDFPKNAFVPGRLVNTCCEDDMAFFGFVVKSNKADKFADRDWVEVTAKIHIEYWKDYEGEGPVLYASDIHRTIQPAQDIISFM